MKKIVTMVLLTVLLGNLPAFASVEPSGMLQTNVSVLGNASNYSTSKTVTYEDKNWDTCNFQLKGTPHSYVSFVTGASGQEGDYAVSMQMRDNETGGAYSTTTSVGDFFQLYYTGTKIYEIFGASPIVNEFDIRLDTNCDIITWTGQNLWYGSGGDLLQAHTFFNSDGYIKGTSYAYPVGEWIHIKMAYTRSTDTWNTWVTDKEGTKQIVTNARANAGTWQSGGRSTFNLIQSTGKGPSTAPAGFALDNYKLYVEKEPEDGYLFAPQDELAANDTEPVLFSVNAKGGDKIQFCINDTEVALFAVPDQSVAYCYSEAIDLFAFPEGNASFTVNKITGDSKTPIATKAFTLSQQIAENVKIDKISADTFTAGNTANVDVSIKKRVGAKEPMVFACIYNEDGGLVGFDSGLIDGKEAKLTLNIPAEYTTEFTSRIYLLEDPLLIADTAEIQ